MSILKQKLDKAANEFESHNFQRALYLYEDCLVFCRRTDESRGVIRNIMSSKGALYAILGNIDAAMSTLNEALRYDPANYLCLLRRSQVYKKKNKFRKALHDLEEISVYCPDNLQVVAMKIEIENLINKNKKGQYTESSDSDTEEEEDELMTLNFANLKQIDRRSVSIALHPQGRKSRVTISGDSAVEYEAGDDGNDKSNYSTFISKYYAKYKFLKTSKEIEYALSNSKPYTSVIIKGPQSRSKSILKNNNTKILFEDTPPAIEKYGGRYSKLIDKLKNIDGKIISATTNVDSKEGSKKEVYFRKSLFASYMIKDIMLPMKYTNEKPKYVKKFTGRKSCLKRSSFEGIDIPEVKSKRYVRKSKFDSLTIDKIDGQIIKNRQSFEMNKKDNIITDSDSQSYDDNKLSSDIVYSKKYNIETVKTSYGQGPKKRANGSKSILKKNSIILPPYLLSKVAEQKYQSNKYNKKSKKSVMFLKSRFFESYTAGYTIE